MEAGGTRISNVYENSMKAQPNVYETLHLDDNKDGKAVVDESIYSSLNRKKRTRCIIILLTITIIVVAATSVAVGVVFAVVLNRKTLVSGTCNGWVQFGNSCYNFLDDMPRTFLDADVKCSQYNSHVLYVESADENIFLKQQLGKFSVEFWWNGMTDIKEEGIWRWYGTDKLVTFFDWSEGEPNNWPTENCCHIWKNYSYQWNDTPCNPPPGYEAYAICEKTVTDLTA